MCRDAPWHVSMEEKMKKILVVLALFAALIFVVSCGGGSKTGDKTDSGEVVNDEDGDTADSGSTDNPDSDNPDTAPDNPDSDDTNTNPDAGDSAPDNGDTTPDGGDSQPDDGDTEPDNDYPQTPCDPNPCLSDANSTGTCNPVTETQYTCECSSGYYWHGTTDGCKTEPLTLGNICTGQNKCYANSGTMTCPVEGEDFFGQDAWYASLGKCVPQNFTVQTISDQNVVLDNNTGLMWQQTIPTDAYKWDGAVSYCNSLSYAGYSDWRLPTPQELLTIVDNSRYNPATDTTYFPNTPSGYFWSSSTYVYSTDYAWYVGFNGGNVSNPNKTHYYYVRCVRRTALPTSSFDSTTVNDDVIVTDSKTGLIWQKTYEIDKTWQAALDYCEDLTYAGYSDWRLPNKNELASLVNYEKYDPASDFPDMPSQYFWSSSTLVDNTNGAWFVDFYAGRVDVINKSYNIYVRCVR